MQNVGAELTKEGADWTRGRNDYLRCWNDQGPFVQNTW
jgi:hypothetical protein